MHVVFMYIVLYFTVNSKCMQLIVQAFSTALQVYNVYNLKVYEEAKKTEPFCSST